jgi:hypothetical protein
MEARRHSLEDRKQSSVVQKKCKGIESRQKNSDYEYYILTRGIQLKEKNCNDKQL